MSRLEHVGIAVRNADSAARLYDTLLQLLPYKVEEVAHESVTTYFLDGGCTKLEFLVTDDPDSAIGRYMHTHGPGLHHLAFEVDDLHEVCERAIDAGIRIIGDGPKPGADGKDVVFLHPKDTFGVLIELCQSTRPLWRETRAQYKGEPLRYFTAGSAGNPVLLIVNSQFETGLGQLVPRLESSFHIFGIESANDFPAVPDIIESTTQHASDMFYLLTTQQQAPSVAKAFRNGLSSLPVSRSIVVCGASADVDGFGDLPGLMIAATEQLPLPDAFQSLPVAVLPNPVSSTEETFLNWILLVLKAFFVRRNAEA